MSDWINEVNYSGKPKIAWIEPYLKNDGKCVVTGVPMKLSECEPDHRIPYSSAKAEAERNGTTIQEEQAKLDDFQSNLDLMVGPVNQFKSSLINDKLLNIAISH